MFTGKSLKKRNLRRPPVRGCKCFHCANARANPGWFGYPGPNVNGRRAHDPENFARLLLKEYVSEEQFQEYLRLKHFYFQGPSGLWYSVGYHGDGNSRLNPSWPRVYTEHDSDTFVVGICVHNHGVYFSSAMLAVQTYTEIMRDEEGFWKIASQGHIYAPARWKMMEKIMEEKFHIKDWFTS